jgi:hypothetical protein
MQDVWRKLIEVTVATSPKACLQCRSVKLKCVTSGNETTCERCARKLLKCIFQDHRRGRKPGTQYELHEFEEEKQKSHATLRAPRLTKAKVSTPGAGNHLQQPQLVYVRCCSQGKTKKDRAERPRHWQYNRVLTGVAEAYSPPGCSTVKRLVEAFLLEVS